jgi:hypothetical protein
MRQDDVKGDMEAYNWESQLHFPMYLPEVNKYLIILDHINFSLVGWEQHAQRAVAESRVYKEWARDAADGPSMLGFVRFVVKELAELVRPWALKRLSRVWSPGRFFTMSHAKMFLLPQVRPPAPAPGSAVYESGLWALR